MHRAGQSAIENYITEVRKAGQQLTLAALRKLGRAKKEYDPEKVDFAPPETKCMPWDEWLPTAARVRSTVHRPPPT